MTGKFIYANGYNISQARKLFDYCFGPFLIKADRNDKELRFDIFVRDKILTEENEIMLLDDWCDIDRFNEFWNRITSVSQKTGVFNINVLQQNIKKLQEEKNKKK